MGSGGAGGSAGAPPAAVGAATGSLGAVTRALAQRAQSIPYPRRQRPGERAIGEAKMGVDTNRRVE